MSTRSTITGPNKEVNEILRAARALGWTAMKGGKHWKLVPPGGLSEENPAVLTCPATPSDARWKANWRGSARRFGAVGQALVDAVDGKAAVEPKTNGGPTYLEPISEAVDEARRRIEARDAGPTVAIEEITPDLAQKMLDAMFEGQRAASKFTLQQYRQDFRNGDFGLNGDAIMIDTEGRTINGQHRLLACVDTGVTFTAVVMRNVPTDTYKVTDKGKKRTLATTLHAMGVPYFAPVASAIKLLDTYARTGRIITKGRHGGSATETQLLALLDRNPGLPAAANFGYNTFTKLHWSQSSLTLLYYLFETVDPIAGPGFFATLTDGMSAWGDDAHYDPAVHLRSALIGRLALPGDRRPDDEYYAALAIKAWNAYVKGTPIRQLRWTSRNEPFPAIHDPFNHLLKVFTGPEKEAEL